MKKQMISVLALAALAAGATIAFAGELPGTGIVGSKHDMNLLDTSHGIVGSDDGEKRVCAFCHTPHHKVDAAALDYNPLWSHEISVSAYKAYGPKTDTFDGTILADPLTGPSRLCMSCHDGVIAVDQHYGMAGKSAAVFNQDLMGDNFGDIAVGAGYDLSNDHPIGFDISAYTAGTVDAQQAGGMQVFGNAIKTQLDAPNNLILDGKAFDTVGFVSEQGTIFTCASCHEVHNKDNREIYFLYEKQAGSAICIMCHDK